MIHEFALDPEALKGWQEFRYLVEKFGIPHGRLISKFPNHWKRLIYEACEGCGDLDKKRIAESLVSIDNKLISSGRPYDQTQTWIFNAKSSHAQLPFRAIISVNGTEDGPDVLVAETLSEANAKWSVPRGMPIPRRANKMAEAVGMLLYCSSEIVFVDPHYSTVSRYWKPLAAMLRRAKEGKPIRRIEYHLGNNGTSEFFEQKLTENLQHLGIPDGIKIIFIRWRQIADRDTLHPRYVLTERGGIRFDHGLDEGNEGESTDVECLDETIYQHRWSQFQYGSGQLDFVDAWIVTATAVSPAAWANGQFR